MKLSQSVIVEAPPAFCYECLTRIEDAPKYISMLKSLKMLTPGGAKVGARWRETIEAFGRRLSLEATMVELNPPVGYRFETKHRGVLMGVAFAVSPEGAQRSRVDLSMDGVGLGLAGKIALMGATPFRSRILATAAQELAGLKRAIEAEYAEAAA